VVEEGEEAMVKSGVLLSKTGRHFGGSASVVEARWWRAWVRVR
jgi:hypothetical protein